MMKPNTVTQLLLFFVLAISVNFFKLKFLLVLFLLLFAVLVISKNHASFLKIMIRFKWFFLFMLLIYSFNTPGEHVAGWLFSISPSYEGVTAATVQALRVLLMLAGLSLILALNSRQQLISGFYFIFSPLQYLGLKVERFAARLWLTLHYVEIQTESRKKQSFISQLYQMAEPEPAPDTVQLLDDVNIQLILPHFSMADFIIMGTFAVVILFATGLL
jgi:energy-coupling factor transporter transmembrane protein EcfT